MTEQREKEKKKRKIACVKLLNWLAAKCHAEDEDFSQAERHLLTPVANTFAALPSMIKKDDMY